MAGQMGVRPSGGADHHGLSYLTHGTVQLGEGDDTLRGNNVTASSFDGGPGTDAGTLGTSSGNTCQNFESGTCG